MVIVDYKYSRERGTLRDGGSSTSWKDGADVQAGIPTYSDAAIAATVDYCEYIFNRYGRFPANSGPFRTVLARRSVAKLDELARVPEVLLDLWIKGFGVRLDEPYKRGAVNVRQEVEGF